MYGWEPLVLSERTRGHTIPSSQNDIESALNERIDQMQRVKGEALDNIARAQERRIRTHASRNGITQERSQIKEGSVVKVYNARKRTRKGYSGRNYLGPYTVASVNSHGQCSLKNVRGDVMRTKYPISRLELFVNAPV